VVPRAGDRETERCATTVRQVIKNHRQNCVTIAGGAMARLTAQRDAQKSARAGGKRRGRPTSESMAVNFNDCLEKALDFMPIDWVCQGH
jgi:hypothetical protein